MPRAIGARVGVNETRDRLAAGGRRGTARPRGCAGGPPPTPYGDIEPITSEPSRCGLSERPAPDVPEAATTTTSSGSSSPAAKPGARARPIGGRVAAGHGDPARAGQPVALLAAAGERQLGQPGRPAPGVAAAVEPLPGRRVGQPEVRAAVDHDHVGRAARRPARPRRRAAGPGRRRRGRPAPAAVVGSRTRSASGTSCGWCCAEPAAGRAGGRQRADLDLRVAEQQAQHLAAGVAARAGDGDPDAHVPLLPETVGPAAWPAALHDHTQDRNFIQCEARRGGARCAQSRSARPAARRCSRSPTCPTREPGAGDVVVEVAASGRQLHRHLPAGRDVPGPAAAGAGRRGRRPGGRCRGRGRGRRGRRPGRLAGRPGRLRRAGRRAGRPLRAGAGRRDRPGRGRDPAAGHDRPLPVPLDVRRAARRHGGRPRRGRRRRAAADPAGAQRSAATSSRPCRRRRRPSCPEAPAPSTSWATTSWPTPCAR